MRSALWFSTVLMGLLGCSLAACAQGNYEIQVYGSETVAPKTTMVELHSNYTVDGQHYVVSGVYPTNHQLHETVEITQGLNDWSEVGFYIFTSTQDGHGDRGRLSACGVFAGYMDVGDSADCGQDVWALVPGI